MMSMITVVMFCAVKMRTDGTSTMINDFNWFAVMIRDCKWLFRMIIHWSIIFDMVVKTTNSYQELEVTMHL